MIIQGQSGYNLNPIIFWRNAWDAGGNTQGQRTGADYIIF